MYCSFLWKWHIMNNCSVFCFHLGCGLGLYLLHTIQMLLRKQNYEYSCCLSTLFATVASTSFLFSILSMVWGRDQVLVEDGSLYPEVGWVKNWRSLLSKENIPLACPSPHSVAMRWRGYNPNLLMGNKAGWGASLFTGLQFPGQMMVAYNAWFRKLAHIRISS